MKRRKKKSGFITIATIIVIAAAFVFFRTADSNEIFSSETAKETVSRYAEKHGIDYNEYPENLIALLSRNEETKDFVLSYPKEHKKEQSKPKNKKKQKNKNLKKLLENFKLMVMT